MNAKLLALEALFDEDTIRKATHIVACCGTHASPHKQLQALVRPQMGRIDEITHQRNDLAFMAYALEAVAVARMG